MQLCPSTTFTLNNPVSFTADSQELSTQGYPTGSTRATIMIDSKNTNMTALIGGFYRNKVKLLNVIVDGNRPTGWRVPSGSSANIELGAGATGVTVANVGSKNPRGLSCMHIAEGSTTYPFTCVNANISSNDIGPCGDETQWADGISFGCSASTVSNNKIMGPTDGGIVLFGAPGTAVSGNTITGSATQRGFGAINLVDFSYGGNYSGVVVKNNTIVGSKMFNIGIAIGSSVWGVESGSQYYLQGPVQILGNTFSGNIVTAIAINGWQKGLTVTGNLVTAVVKPNYLFADANVGFQDNDCTGQYSTWKVFNSNARLSYWSPGIKGALTLDPAFVNASSGGPNYYLCSKPAIAPNATFAPSVLRVTPDNGKVAVLHRGLQLQYPGDNNLVAVNYSDPDNAVVVWASGHAGYSCTDGVTECVLQYQPDSNLVNLVNGTPIWASATNNGDANKLVILNQAPWMEILGPTGKLLWDTTHLK